MYFSFENLKCKYFRKVFKMHSNAFDPMSACLGLSSESDKIPVQVENEEFYGLDRPST